MLSLAGSLFAEISPAKLVVSWTMLFILPGLLLGLTPLIASAWIILIKDKIASPLIGIWPVMLLALLAGVGLLGARSIFRMAESSFWSLNSLAIEPVYATCREVIRHLAGKLSNRRPKDRETPLSVFSPRWRPVLRCSARRRLMGCCLAGVALVGQHFRSRLAAASGIDRSRQQRRAGRILILAIAALVWAFADACMPQPRDLGECPQTSRSGASGASPTCPIFTRSANRMAFVSRVVDRVDAATFAWRRS